MGRIFLGISALLFFFAAVGVHFIPNPSAWGMVALALGLFAGGGGAWNWTFWRKKG